jgi:hypothetical protein
MARAHSWIFFDCEEHVSLMQGACFAAKAYPSIRREGKQEACALSMICSQKDIQE